MNEIINSSDLEYMYVSKNDFVVKWRMTNWCNFRCSYCIRKKHISSYKQTMQEQLEKAKNIRAILENINKPIDIFLIGGEVTWFDLDAIIRELFCKNVKSISITTNFSNSIDYYRNLYNLCKSFGIKLKLTASFHEEFTKIDDYINKVVELPFVKPEMVITSNNIEIAKDFINKLKSNNIKLATLDFDKTLPTEDVKIIKKIINNEKFSNGFYYVLKTKKGEKIIYDSVTIKRNLNFDSVIYCNNLKHMINIDVNGDIYDTMCKYKKKIGDLKNYNKDMFKSFWRKCPGNSCTMCGHIDFKFSNDI